MLIPEVTGQCHQQVKDGDDILGMNGLHAPPKQKKSMSTNFRLGGVLINVEFDSVGEHDMTNFCLNQIYRQVYP